MRRTPTTTVAIAPRYVLKKICTKLSPALRHVQDHGSTSHFWRGNSCKGEPVHLKLTCHLYMIFLFHMRSCPLPSISILIHNLFIYVYYIIITFIQIYIYDISTLLLSIKKAMNAWVHVGIQNVSICWSPPKQAIQLLHTSSHANRDGMHSVYPPSCNSHKWRFIGIPY